MDRPAAEIEDASPNATRGNVGIAALIDQFRAGAAHGSVHKPPAAEPREIDILAGGAERYVSPGAPQGLAGGKALTAVFDDFLSAWYAFKSKYTAALDRRTGDQELEGGIFRTDEARHWAGPPIEDVRPMRRRRRPPGFK